MRCAFFLAGLIGLAQSVWSQAAPNLNGEAWKLELGGQAAEAQMRLQRAAEATPPNPSAIRAYAEFLDRYRDPAARQEYARLAQILDNTKAAAEQRAAAYKRLAELDLAAGD